MDQKHGSEGSGERSVRSAARAQPLYGQRISNRALGIPNVYARTHFYTHLSNLIVHLNAFGKCDTQVCMFGVFTLFIVK